MFVRTPTWTIDAKQGIEPRWIEACQQSDKKQKQFGGALHDEGRTCIVMNHKRLLDMNNLEIIEARFSTFDVLI